jgi:hypothetical protein
MSLTPTVSGRRRRKSIRSTGQANFKPIRSVCRHTVLQCEVT